MIDQYPPANGVLTSLIWRKTAAGGETSLSGYDNASQALSYTPGQEQVYLNGILLVRGDDYTATNGTSITGLSALAANDFVQVNCYNNFSVASVPTTSLTGEVTNSQITSLATSKLTGTIANNQLANSAITINGTATSLGGTYTNSSASTSTAGIVQLTDSTSSTSTTTAATPNSVKSAYDLANGAIQKTLTTTTGDIIYASSANTPARLGIGSTGQVLTVSGGVPSWSAPAGGGKVLQVVQGTYSTQVNTYSTSYSDTGLTASITPSSSSSKILILISQGAWVGRNSTNAGLWFSLVRNTSPELQIKWMQTEAAQPSPSPVSTAQTVTWTYLDSPNTTSTTTYKTQFKLVASDIGGWGGAANYQTNSSIVLLEIGA